MSTRRQDGTIIHGELKIGDSIIMFSKANNDSTTSPATFYLYMKNTDKIYDKVIKAGGISITNPMDQFYGDRNAGVKDIFGNQW